jgi:hypothetical protein
MCFNVVARFRCANTHQQRGDGWGQHADMKMKYIAKCTQARVYRRPTCTQRDTIHVAGEDESDIDCPECRGDTPPETP